MDVNLPSKLISDQTRLWQILKNVLDNSAKYTEEGSIQLDVSLVDRLPTGLENICFKVTDTGYGISKEQMARLFTPFEQFHTNHSNQPAGTGLGMVITKQMVELMHGQIHVESEENVGTCTSITIPFLVPQAAKTIVETLKDVSLAKHSILVADDDPIAIEMMEEILNAAGVTPVCVSSGEEAVAVYQQYLMDGKPFDIAIIDYRMGGMNGIQTALALRAMAEHKLAKLLMVSSYTKQLILSEIEKVGYEDVIEKPFTPSDFIRRLDEILDVSEKFNSFDDIIFPKAKVLVCEDNIINQEVAIGVLEAFAIEPTIANNGREALEILENETFDLILMDILMPEMDGNETTRRIRLSGKPYQNIPIVAMTANVMAEEIQKCMDDGMNGHIGKPISFDKIFVKLNEWLSNFAEQKNKEKTSQTLSGVFANFEAAGNLTNFETPVMEGLRKMEGFAVDEGLARFMNNEARYVKALKKFASQISDYILPIEEAMNPENKSKVDVNVHTLKGVAGNLGLKVLQEEAAAYEKLKTNQQYEKLVASAVQKTNEILTMIGGA